MGDILSWKTHLLDVSVQISDFEYKGLLGHGGYGSVHLTLEKQTNALYAMKVNDSGP